MRGGKEGSGEEKKGGGGEEGRGEEQKGGVRSTGGGESQNRHALNGMKY